MSDYSKLYIEGNEPLEFCPDCDSDLTEMDAVEVVYGAAVDESSFYTRLDIQGNLIDEDDIVASGLHKQTLCASCGEDLDDYEF